MPPADPNGPGTTPGPNVSGAVCDANRNCRNPNVVTDDGSGTPTCAVVKCDGGGSFSACRRMTTMLPTCREKSHNSDEGPEAYCQGCKKWACPGTGTGGTSDCEASTSCDTPEGLGTDVVVPVPMYGCVDENTQNPF